jgi:hypothetical protein
LPANTTIESGEKRGVRKCLSKRAPIGEVVAKAQLNRSDPQFCKLTAVPVRVILMP